MPPQIPQSESLCSLTLPSANCKGPGSDPSLCGDRIIGGQNGEWTNLHGHKYKAVQETRGKTLGPKPLSARVQGWSHLNALSHCTFSGPGTPLATARCLESSQEPIPSCSCSLSLKGSPQPLLSLPDSAQPPQPTGLFSSLEYHAVLSVHLWRPRFSKF